MRPVLRPAQTTTWDSVTGTAGPKSPPPDVIDAPGAWRFDFGRELPAHLEIDLEDWEPVAPPLLAGSRWLWAVGGVPYSSASVATSLDLTDADRITLVVAVHGAATVWLDDRLVGRVLRADAPLVCEVPVPADPALAVLRVDAAGDATPGVAAVVVVSGPRLRRETRSDATWWGGDHAEVADVGAVGETLPGCWPSGGISLGVSEFAEPMAVNPGPLHPVKIAAPTHVEGDTFRLQLNADGFEGARFGWLFVHTTPARPFRVTGVRLVSVRELPEAIGRFHSSDPEVDAVWDAAGHSLAVHVGTRYLTPILVDRGDRGQASGDSLPMTDGALAVFGALPVLRTNLDAVFGGDDYGGIESFGLYRVLTELALFWWSGDTAPLLQRRERLVAELERVDAAFDDPAVGWFGWDERIGGGFNTPLLPEAVAALRALFVRTATETADAFDLVGETTLARHWHERAADRADQLQAGLAENLGTHAHAELALARVGGPLPEASRVSRVSYSPFNQLTILEALAAAGEHERALTTLKDHWGGQLRYGATTYFEVFRPEWATALPTNGIIPGSDCGWSSLAHGWGAGVAGWMARELLGVRPVRPGYATTAIAPHPAGLERLSGAAPTPHGLIEVDYDGAAGRIEVVVPAGIERTEITLPPGGSPPIGPMTSVVHGPGRHVLQRPTGPAPVTAHDRGPREPWHYPRASRLDDRTVGGDGLAAYGAAGYVLFDHAGSGADVAALPDFVESVHVHDDPAGWGTAVHRVVTDATTDRRALPDPRTGVRRLGGRATRPPREMGLTFGVDVRVRPDAPPFQLALYLIDWERLGRRCWLEPYDLSSLELIAAPVAVDGCAEGRWIGFDCSGDTRIRVKQIGWTDIVLGAVGFVRTD